MEKNLGQILLELLAGAWNLLVDIYYQDYSFLKKELWGVSVEDILTILLVTEIIRYLIRQITSAIIKFTSNLITRFFNFWWTFLFNITKYILLTILTRAWKVVVCYWGAESVIRWRHRWEIRYEHIVNIFQKPA